MKDLENTLNFYLKHGADKFIKEYLQYSEDDLAGANSEKARKVVGFKVELTPDRIKCYNWYVNEAIKYIVEFENGETNYAYFSIDTMDMNLSTDGGFGPPDEEMTVYYPEIGSIVVKIFDEYYKQGLIEKVMWNKMKTEFARKLSAETIAKAYEETKDEKFLAQEAVDLFIF